MDYVNCQYSALDYPLHKTIHLVCCRRGGQTESKSRICTLLEDVEKSGQLSDVNEDFKAGSENEGKGSKLMNLTFYRDADFTVNKLDRNVNYRIRDPYKRDDCDIDLKETGCSVLIDDNSRVHGYIRSHSRDAKNS